MRWGLLGYSDIARNAILPALERGGAGKAVAVGTRDPAAAKAVSTRVALRFTSYEALLADTAVDAVYLSLPNALHQEWSAKAVAAGKHVLCEKPLVPNASSLEPLARAARENGVHLEEALMIKSHPQWDHVRELVAAAPLGPLRAVIADFGITREDPADIRNQAALDGGARLDLGVYLVSAARMLFAREPVRVSAMSRIDPEFGVDVLTSMVLDFDERDGAFGHALLGCGTRMASHHRLDAHFADGRLEMPTPFVPRADRPCRVDVFTPNADAPTTRRFEPLDQYDLQLRHFVAAARGEAPARQPLDESSRTLRVLDAVREAAASGRRVEL